MADVQFFVNSRHLRASKLPLSDIRWATFVYPAFNYQNNAVRRELIVHGRSGHQYACAVSPILFRVE